VIESAALGKDVVHLRVTGLQTLLGVALAEVIGTSVNDDGSANDGVGSDESQVGVCNINRTINGLVT